MKLHGFASHSVKWDLVIFVVDHFSRKRELSRSRYTFNASYFGNTSHDAEWSHGRHRGEKNLGLKRPVKEG